MWCSIVLHMDCYLNGLKPFGGIEYSKLYTKNPEYALAYSGFNIGGILLRIPDLQQDQIHHKLFYHPGHQRNYLNHT